MMSIKCILLDIEGTTSSISFVYDVMFPFVRKNLDSFLAENWNAATVQDCLPLLANELGQESVAQWLGGDDESANSAVATGVIRLMDNDVKATGLKKLQGAIWKAGFESGELVAHLYGDVAPAIKAWNQLGMDVRIYSSGSVQAQKLFFAHTLAGNLLPLLKGHYDTTIGNKKEKQSYVAIADDIGVAAEDVLFVSDIAAELDAAAAAGMETRLSIRPGNHPVENLDRYQRIDSFSDIEFAKAESNG